MNLLPLRRDGVLVSDGQGLLFHVSAPAAPKCKGFRASRRVRIRGAVTKIETAGVSAGRSALLGEV